MVKIANRIQIPFSFNYPSGGNLVPAAAVSVGVYVRNNDGSQGSPAPVYEAQSGTAQYSSMQTDAGGNVPGWVAEGTYKIVAAASGGFGGGTINFDALYGGGTSQIAVGAVGAAQIAANAVDVPQLALDVSQALVPPGVILDYAGSSPPAGFLACNGTIVSQSSYPNLYSAIGSTWNIGGEGSGNFRLPNATNKFHLGAGGALVLGGSGGTLGHTHSPGSLYFGVPSLTVYGTSCSVSVPTLSVSAHSHSLSGNGFVQLGITSWGGQTAFAGNGAGSFQSSSLWWDDRAWGYEYAPQIVGGFALGGSTDVDSAVAYGAAAYGSTSTSSTVSADTVGSGGITGSADPPYIVVNKIIKY